MSIDTTSEQPLDANSYEIFPVPENKSKTVNPGISNLFEIILKRDSFTLSVVGLTGRFFGALIEILFLVPDIILIYN
ncbi:MAG: hypothetical protein L7U31_02440 [Flavobacteriaceae bacterium]|nr:hypothetical protein [Flavobacteriaceae bacterium]